MSFFNREFNNTDFISQIPMIQEEGLYELIFSQIDYSPASTRIENGEEKTQNASLSIYFKDKFNKFASVRYYPNMFQNAVNLLEYMIDGGYFRGLPENFDSRYWSDLPIDDKVILINSLTSSTKKTIGVNVEARISAKNNEFFIYQISEDTSKAMEKHEAETLSNDVPLPENQQEDNSETVNVF